MRRPDETPWPNVIANMLTGCFVGLLLFAIAPVIRGVDDNLAELD